MKGNSPNEAAHWRRFNCGSIFRRPIKCRRPRYQTVLNTEIPVVNLDGGAGYVRVIAGGFKGIKGPAKTFTPVNLYDLRLKAKHQAEISLAAGYTTALFVLHGEVMVEGRPVKEAELAVFDTKGETIHLDAKEDATVLVLNGEPILEPVAHYGPFVMNTRDELIQAAQDYQAGRMGHLEPVS